MKSHMRAAVCAALPAQSAAVVVYRRARAGERANLLSRLAVDLLQHAVHDLRRGHLHPSLLELEQAQ